MSYCDNLRHVRHYSQVVQLRIEKPIVLKFSHYRQLYEAEDKDSQNMKDVQEKWRINSFSFHTNLFHASKKTLDNNNVRKFSF